MRGHLTPTTMREAADEAMRRRGVRIGQNLVREALWQTDGVTPGELAERLQVETPTVVKSTTRMQTGSPIRPRPAGAAPEPTKESEPRLKCADVAPPQTCGRTAPTHRPRARTSGLSLAAATGRLSQLELLAHPAQQVGQTLFSAPSLRSRGARRRAASRRCHSRTLGGRGRQFLRRGRSLPRLAGRRLRAVFSRRRTPSIRASAGGRGSRRQAGQAPRARG